MMADTVSSFLLKAFHFLPLTAAVRIKGKSWKKIHIAGKQGRSRYKSNRMKIVFLNVIAISGVVHPADGNVGGAIRTGKG